MAYRKDDIPKVKLDFPKIDLSGVDFAMKNMNTIFDNIAKDIRERQDNAMAMEFTKCIGELLRKNGVIPKITEYTRENVKENSIEQLYGVSIDELDFSEHDEVFEDKIAELKKNYQTVSRLLSDYQQENKSLKQRIAELESKNENLKQGIDKMATSKSKWIDKTVEWQQKCEKLESKETEIVSDIDTSNPLACAESLIEHMTHCEKFMIMPERDVQTFSVEELKEIADYLMVYYKHHKDRDAEDAISF